MEVRSGYKKTEAGVIPDEWDAVELDAVCSMKSGEGITAASIDQFSEYPCYGGNGLRGYTSRFTHDGSFALVGRQGALCGNVVGAEGKFFASEHAVVVTAKSGTDIRFLSYVLGEMRLNRFSESSAQPGLSVSKVLKLPLGVPPTETEQRAIATALSDVDALLSGLDRLIAKKHDLKQAAMQQLLTGQTRLPGFHGEWEVKALRDILTTPITDGPHLTPKFLADGVPFLSVNNLVNNRLDLRSLRFVSKEDHLEFSKKCKPRKGDILFGKAASVGMVALIDTDMALNIWSPLALIRIGDQASETFVYYALQASQIHRQIKILTNSSSQGNIGMSDIGLLEMPMPNRDEQTDVAAILSDMDAELSALEARRDKTRNLKQAMMQELLTGKTRLVPEGGAHA